MPGADYERGLKSLILFDADTNVAAGATEYYVHGGHGANSAWLDIPVPANGVIRGMRNKATAPPGVGESYTYALMVNGFASALISQTTGAVLSRSTDLVNAAVVAEGDDICIRVVTTGGAVASRHRTGMQFIPF